MMRGKAMARIVWELGCAVGFAVLLTGCVGMAGVSTWEYQAGPGYEMQRTYDGRIQADTSRGLTREACTSVSTRGTGPAGGGYGSDVTDCRSTSPRTR